MDNSYWGYAQIGAPAYMHPAAMPTDGRYPHLVRNLPSIVQPGIYPDQGQMGQHGPGHRPQYARGVPLQPILPYPTPGPMGPNAAGRPPVPVPGMLFSTPQPVPILPRTYPFQEQAVHGRMSADAQPYVPPRESEDPAPKLSANASPYIPATKRIMDTALADPTKQEHSPGLEIKRVESAPEVQSPPKETTPPLTSPCYLQSVKREVHLAPASVQMEGLMHCADPVAALDQAILASQMPGNEHRTPTTLEIPLSLPPPVIQARTNPYIDLSAHLKHHGMEAEAEEFTRSQTTCDFVLTAFLTMYAPPGTSSPAAVSSAGETLMSELEHAVRAREKDLQAQLAAIAARDPPLPGSMHLPLELHLPWLHPPSGIPNATLPFLPTHFLAVCRRRASPLANGVRVVEAPCFLVPIHWIVYALQCAHLPTMVHGTGGVPVLECTVPFPQHWALIHRWLYTRDTGKLLASLLPLGTLRALRTPSQRTTRSREALAAIAALSLPTLTRLALKIRATWHNGRAIGIYAESFWLTLRRAWDLMVCAIVVRKGRVGKAQLEVHSA